MSYVPNRNPSHNHAEAAAHAFSQTGACGEVVLAGDWHGEGGWARHAIRIAATASLAPVILQVGDFGFWPHHNGNRYLHALNKELKLRDRWVVVTPGNHEDYVRISAMHPVPGMPGVVWNPDYPRILVFERGARWTWGGKSLLSVGGANSIDKQFRRPGRNWWEGERITFDDVKRATDGGPADIMITHEAPEGVDLGLTSRSQDSGWPQSALDYALESKAMMRRITDVVQPSALFHGHYHKWIQVDSELHAPFRGTYTLRTHGLDKDYSAHNLGLLRFGSRQLERIQTPKPDWSFRDQEGILWDEVPLLSR